MSDMKALLLILTFVIVGCQIDTTESKQVGENRHKIFKECMDAAAKMPRQADDDVSDVVEACSTQALYMARSLQGRQ